VPASTMTLTTPTSACVTIPSSTGSVGDEQGVLLVQPYKSELLPLWPFKNPEVARESSPRHREKFDVYLADGDLVGADLARKFLQMGFTVP